MHKQKINNLPTIVRSSPLFLKRLVLTSFPLNKLFLNELKLISYTRLPGANNNQYTYFIRYKNI